MKLTNKKFAKANFLFENIKSFMNHLLDLPENEEFNKRMKKLNSKTKLYRNVFRAWVKYKISGDKEEFAEKALLAFRNMGLHVPLNFTLLFKNQKVLEGMKKEVAD